MNGSKLPHSLRLVIFFLRIALGLDFVYLGLSSLFNHQLEQQVSSRSFTDLYAWIGGTMTSGTLGPVFAWAFLIIGVCLIAGLLTRFAAIVGIALALVGYLPTLTSGVLSISQFVNDEVLVVICLLVLIFSNAGAYLGLDMFIRRKQR